MFKCNELQTGCKVAKWSAPFMNIIEISYIPYMVNVLRTKIRTD